MSVPRNRIIVGDVRDVLPALPTASVDCIITSPPYFALRNYRADGQIGLETSVDAWVEELRLVLRGLARVLKPTGSLWLNLGDTYSRHERDGAPPKSLLLGPERLALAMIDDGWIIRSKVIWAKTNPMPTSVRDRLSCTYEVVYFATRNAALLLRSRRHSYPAPLIAQQAQRRRGPTRALTPSDRSGPARLPAATSDSIVPKRLAGSDIRLARTPATSGNTRPARGAANTTHCFLKPSLLDQFSLPAPRRSAMHAARPGCGHEPTEANRSSNSVSFILLATTTPGTRPGFVLDPFIGAGTTAIVAERYERDWLGIELKASFAAAARRRIEAERARSS